MVKEIKPADIKIHIKNEKAQAFLEKQQKPAFLTTKKNAVEPGRLASFDHGTVAPVVAPTQPGFTAGPSIFQANVSPTYPEELVRPQKVKPKKPQIRKL
jgi:hypothetical protein